MNRIAVFLIAGLLLVLGSSNFAHAANCGSYPYTLTNGQTADANQVMADFNLIRDCANSSLLGKNNNLSDVQSPATSRTNLGLGAAAVEGLSNSSAGAVVDDGSGNLVVQSFPTLHSQVFTGSGTFVIPATASSATAFRFVTVGGGGGGGTSSAYGGGGGSGGYGWALFTGFTPSASVTITVGSGGSGVTGNAVGGIGGTTTVTYSATTIVSATGGAGGQQINGGATGSFSTSVGGGLSLVASQAFGAQPGTQAGTGIGPGNGGGCPICSGGLGPGSGGGNGNNGRQGGGGSGQGSSVGGNTSGSGGSGAVIVEWVL